MKGIDVPMKNHSKGSIIILITGIISIIIITFCAFQKELIVHKYFEYKVSKNYSQIPTNNYFLEDHFTYVDNYTKTGIKNRQDLINFIYFTLNSGATYIERYIDESYTTYNDDIAYLTANNGEKFKDLISILNNFVHPYNSSTSIKLTYGGDYTIAVNVNRAYSEEEINSINRVVDEVIKEKIKNSTPTKEKIRLIHDYIIDNTEYDKLKYENKDDTTYKSNTAYGVLIEGYGTCNGYADAMAIFLNKLNIINYKISNEEHIWNLVYLDGKWYHLDLTWDDPISDLNINRDTYFLITTDTLEKLNDGTHNLDKSVYVEASL